MAGIVAVTGGTGFIGSHVVRRLATAGWHVRLLTRRLPVHPVYADLPIEAVIGHMQDQRSLAVLLNGADAVVHLAGTLKAHSRTEFFVGNAAATRRIARLAAEQARPPRFLHVSSLAARMPALSHYCASKRAAEEEFADIGDALSWIILRPPAVYGPGDLETLNIFKQINRRFVVFPNSQERRFSLIHVRDVADSIAVFLEETHITNSIFEIDDGREGGYGWPDIIDAAARRLAVQPLKLGLPGGLVRSAGWLSEQAGRLRRRPVMFTAGKAAELLHANWVADKTNLLAKSVWRPSLSIEQGFADTIKWYQDVGWL